MENQVYNWLVKKGNLVMQRNGDCIVLQINYEDGTCCLLAHADTCEIIDLLTTISRHIWENPDYERKPYTHQLFKTNGNEYFWQIGTSQLLVQYNETEDAVQLKCNGNSRLNLEINQVIEIIQILEHLNQQAS